MNNRMFSLLKDSNDNSQELSIETAVEETTKKAGTLVLPEHAGIIHCGNPRRDGKQIKHTPVEGAVFAKPPTSDDIWMGDFKDCFLLTALHSILAQQDGEEIIRSMFQDRGETVIVRLFLASKPVYVKIEKSITDALSPGALWVKLLEKAYAIVASARFQPELTNYDFGDYRVLNGPIKDFSIGLEILTGAPKLSRGDLPTQSRIELSQLNKTRNFGDIYLFNALMQFDANRAADVLESPSVPIENEIYLKVFNRNNGYFNSWSNWIRDKKNDWETFITNKRLVRLADLEKFFNSYRSDADFNQVIDCVLNWVRQNQVLSGRLFSGVYSSEELKTFNKIDSNLKSQQPMLVWNDQIKHPKENLMPCHTYAIVGVEESPSNKKFIYLRHAEPKLKPLLKPIFNMFGIGTNRSSEEIKTGPRQGEVKVTTKKESTPLCLELSDFCEAFNHMWTLEEVSLKTINERCEAFNRMQTLKEVSSKTINEPPSEPANTMRMR